MNAQVKLREIGERNIINHHAPLTPRDLAVLESLVRPIKINTFLSRLLDGLTKALHNNSPQWNLKGHSPLMVRDEAPAEPEGPNLKVGRNELAPAAAAGSINTVVARASFSAAS